MLFCWNSLCYSYLDSTILFTDEALVSDRLGDLEKVLVTGAGRRFASDHERDHESSIL